MTTTRAIVQAQRLVELAQAHLRSLLLEAVVERDGTTDCSYCEIPTLVVHRPASATWNGR